MSSRRQYGFGAVQPISVEAILAYIDLHGIDHPDDRELFADLIDQLDDKWLELYARNKND